jgi:hypothetical protein
MKLLPNTLNNPAGVLRKLIRNAGGKVDKQAAEKAVKICKEPVDLVLPFTTSKKAGVIIGKARL